MNDWRGGPVAPWDTAWDTIPRIARGAKDRVEKLKALGNAVVPQQFYPIFLYIAEITRKGGEHGRAGGKY